MAFLIPTRIVVGRLNFEFVFRHNGKAVEVSTKGSDVHDCFKNDYFSQMGKTGGGQTL